MVAPRLVAGRYGKHPAVVAWQTDNEYGCHDTVLSYSLAARHAFRRWLLKKYVDINALNTAWGTDVLYSAENAAAQGGQLSKLVQWYTPAEAL